MSGKCECSCHGQIRLAQHAWKKMLDDALDILGIADDCRKDVFVLTVAFLGCNALMEAGYEKGPNVIAEQMGKVFSVLMDRGVDLLRETGEIHDSEPCGETTLWSN